MSQATFRTLIRNWLLLAAISMLILTVRRVAFAQDTPNRLTPAEVDEIVDHLRASVQNYVFPDIAAKLGDEIEEHRAHYLTIM